MLIMITVALLLVRGNNRNARSCLFLFTYILELTWQLVRCYNRNVLCFIPPFFSLLCRNFVALSWGLRSDISSHEPVDKG